MSEFNDAWRANIPAGDYTEMLSITTQSHPGRKKNPAGCVAAGGVSVRHQRAVAAALAGVLDYLRASPCYAFFRLSTAGYRWDLTRNSPVTKRPARMVLNPQQVCHWIVPPTGGWTIPCCCCGRHGSRQQPGALQRRKHRRPKDLGRPRRSARIIL
jgi:hypothetical protein